MHAMDYPSCRDFQAHSEKPSQYYSEEYENSTYSTVPRPSANEKPNYLYCQDSFRRLLNASSHYTGRKSPIYVHKYEKIPSSVQENSYQGKHSKANPKVMLDKLEENYWAAWKPKNSFKSNRNVAHGDTHESFKYFNRCDYDTSSSVAQETCHHHHQYYQKNANSYHAKDFQLMYKSERQIQTEKTYHETSEHLEQPDMIDDIYNKNVELGVKDGQFVSKNDQEIQTEYIFPSEEEMKATDKGTSKSKADKEPLMHKDKHSKRKKSPRKEKRHRKKEESDIEEIFLESTAKCVDSTEDSTAKLEPGKVDKEVKGVEDDISENKLLKHKDSFIIHRKKQSEEKEFLQQPKCIRLYRKSTPSFTSRGGSYPLRSCLKRESSFFPTKGNFRLGAPGKPLFVTNSSYSRYM